MTATAGWTMTCAVVSLPSLFSDVRGGGGSAMDGGASSTFSALPAVAAETASGGGKGGALSGGGRTAPLPRLPARRGLGTLPLYLLHVDCRRTVA